jgi:hypothetical protein
LIFRRLWEIHLLLSPRVWIVNKKTNLVSSPLFSPHFQHKNSSNTRFITCHNTHLGFESSPVNFHTRLFRIKAPYLSTTSRCLSPIHLSSSTQPPERVSTNSPRRTNTSKDEALFDCNLIGALTRHREHRRRTGSHRWTALWYLLLLTSRLSLLT